MTWKIEVKPTTHALDAYAWVAQRSDGEDVLFSVGTYPSSAAALSDAHTTIDAHETRQASLVGATVVEQAYVPVVG